MNYGFIIDNRKCIGCHACTVACKAEHDVPVGVNRTWVKYIEKGEFPNTRRIFSVMRCNHCDDAPCVEICPVTALYRRADGIVDFDNRRCIGCKACMQACPYDALYIDPNTNTAAKCNYCAHRVDIGLEPACVNVCPEHAIISGDLDHPESEISQLLAREQVTARKVEKGTRPKLFYIEGDEASLKPIATEVSNLYIWSGQSGGVGHFARYADARISQSSLQLEKTKEVTNENARRVYDAPSKGVVWGWEVAAYIWTKAIATGTFLVLFMAAAFGLAPVDLTTKWIALAVSLIFLFATLGFLVKDLDRPERFAYVLLRPQWRSWLVRGGYALFIYSGLLVLCAASIFFQWQNFESLFFAVTAIFAVVSAIYTAFLFAQAKGRDFWQSPTLLFHMLSHSILGGAAIFALATFFMQTSTEWNSYIRFVLVGAIIFNLAILAAELMTPHATEDARRTAMMITSGRFSRKFWIGVLLMENLVPLVMVWFLTPLFLFLVGCLVLIGIYINEHIWVRAPQSIPLR